MMVEAMIDIETLDTGPRSVVLSIGAVLFDKDGPTSTEPFFQALELDPQFGLYKRTVSQSTIFWWMEQGEVARKASFNPKHRYGVHASLQYLRGFLRGVESVWANSPDFDCTILDSLYADVSNLRSPWDYNEKRDLRTLREESGMSRGWSPVGWKGNAHHPVDDCLFQIEVLREARRRIDA